MRFTRHLWSDQPGSVVPTCGVICLRRPRLARPRPWLLIHGFTGAAESWTEVAAALDDGNGVIAVVLPGHAPEVPCASDASALEDASDAFPFEGAIAGIAAGLERAGLRQVELIGYSLGARVALALALRAPGLAARLTLIGVNPGIDDSARAERRAADQRWARLLRERGIEDFATAWQAQPIFASQARLPASVLRRQHALRRGHDPEALAASLETMGLGAMPDYRERLPELTVPTRIIAGALDDKFLTIARDMIRQAPAIDLHLLGDCGHNPVLERPADLARILRNS